MGQINVSLKCLGALGPVLGQEYSLDDFRESLFHVLL